MLDLPVRSGMCDGGPIDSDVLFITESNKLPAGELCAVIYDDGVWYSKAMDDVEEEQHGLLGWSEVPSSAASSRLALPSVRSKMAPTASSPEA